jgi:uncharacterized protein YoxC
MNTPVSRAIVAFLLIFSLVIAAIGWQGFFFLQEQRQFIADQEKFFGDEKTREQIKLLARQANDIVVIVDQGKTVTKNLVDITNQAKSNLVPHADQMIVAGTGTLKSATGALDAGRDTLNTVNKTVTDLTTDSHKILSDIDAIAMQIKVYLVDPAVVAMFKKLAGNAESITGNIADLTAKLNITTKDINDALPKLLAAVEVIAGNTGVATDKLAKILDQLNIIFEAANKKPSRSSRIASILFQAILIYLKNR